MRIETYNLKLNLSRKEGGFHGEETISLTGSGEQLSLDAVSMEFNSVMLNGRKADFTYDGKLLSISEEINGPTDIFIDYEGKYSEALTGLYLAGPAGSRMITTQFESTGARLAFPCIDNPSFKAEFDLSLIIESEDEAISNMPKKGETFFNGTKIVEFDKTPRMSTYLLYIGVGKLDHMVKNYKGKELILAAPKGLLNTTEMPLEVASRLIDYYEKYYGIDFMLPKMHLIAVPEFAAGAMENWGAITFREVALLINKDTGTSSRAYVYMVIGHEIAHQWFGDLVTMKWWEDLWLNESFANFMGYKSVDHLFPELEMWAFYFNIELMGGFRGDSLKSTHPIHVEVTDPESISQIFDEISYNKGGSILRMIESFMGAQTFRDGIRDYLKKHSFANASSEDLWKALDEHSDYNINEIMGSWINLPGHPVVYVSRKGDKITLQQKTFKLLGSYDDKLWKIPLTVVRSSGTESFLLDEKDGEIPLEGFLKLNRDTTGFYRCFYDPELFSVIVRNLDKLSPYDMWGIVNDNYDFLLSGDIPPATYLERLSHFFKSDEPLIVRTIAGQFSSLDTLLEQNRDIREKAIAYLREKKEVLGDRSENEAPARSMTRETVHSTLASVDRKFADEIADMAKELESVDPDLRQSVLIGNARSRNDPDFLLNLLKNSRTDEDREKIIIALGLMSGKENIEKAVGALKNGLIKAQDSIRLYFAMARHSESRDYMIENYRPIFDFLKNIFAGSGVVSMFVEGTLPYLSIRDHEKALGILNSLKDPESRTGVVKAKEYIEIYGNLRKRFT